MKAKIDLITIWTENIIEMKKFYTNVLGFEVKNDLGEYVELKSEGVRFAICSRKVMYNYTEEYKKSPNGQVFELAFPCETPQEVDDTYKKLISNGAKPVSNPEDMPWNQRAAFFADPDGNIHEVFANL